MENNATHDNGVDTGCICKDPLCKKGECNKDGCNTCITDANKVIFKAGGVCFECDDKESCAECTAAKDKCTKCKAGYALVADKC